MIMYIKKNYFSDCQGKERILISFEFFWNPKCEKCEQEIGKKKSKIFLYSHLRSEIKDIKKLEFIEIIHLIDILSKTLNEIP